MPLRLPFIYAAGHRGPQGKVECPLYPLRACVKLGMKMFDAALLDIAPVLSSARKRTEPEPTLARITRVRALVKAGRYEEAIPEIEIVQKNIGFMTSDMRFQRMVCNYHLGNYEAVMADSDEGNPELSEDDAMTLLWIRSRASVMKDRPMYDRAIEHLDSEKIWNSRCSFLATVDASFMQSCRPDPQNRNGQRALEILDSIRSHSHYDMFVKDFVMAEALANLELENYERAMECLADLKTMYVNEKEFPDLRAIEEAIRNKRRYVPANRIPLSQDKHL